MSYKKRDGFSLFVVVVLLFLVSIYLFIMFLPLFSITTSSKEVSDNINQSLIDRVGLERVYSQLNENISFEGNIVYEDIEKTYQISTITQEMREVQLSNKNRFEVDNATNINIKLQYNKSNDIIDETNDSSYSIRISYNDKIIREYSNLNESVGVTITTDFLYAQKENKTHYGEYVIEIDTYNCYVDTTVTYNELDYREILIEDGNLKTMVITENDKSIGGIKQLYKKDGDI